MNKYLVSTLLTGFLIAAPLPSTASGQEQALQPQGAWTVTKIDRGQGGNSYCTLSRKYSDGIVLSLGRNQSEEYSLAIDFQKQTFPKDKSVNINLQPGPGQIRAYDMMPASDKAVVVRLGWDAGFFDALNQSQQMKVKIADRNYAFAMPQIAKGQADLTTCMENLKTASKDAGGTASKPADTKDVLAAGPVKGGKGFDAEKAEASAPAGEVNARKEQDRNDKPPASRNRSELALNNDDSAPRRNFARNDDTPAKVAPAPARSDAKPLALAEAPVADAKAAAKTDKKSETAAAPAPKVLRTSNVADEKAAQKAAQSEQEAADLQKRLAALSAEKASIEQKNAAERQALEQRLAAAEEQRAKMAKPEELDAIQAKAKELEIKNSQLEDSLRQSQTRIAETAINTETRSMKQILDLQSRLDAAQKDNTALAKQLDSFKLQQEDKKLTMVAGDWNLEQATKRFNEAEREIRRLGLQLEQERTSCNREKSQIESMLFDPAVADQKQIQKLSQLQKELDAAQSSIRDNQKAVDAAVAQQLATRTKDLTDRSAALEAEKAALSQQVASLKGDLAKGQSVVAEKAALEQQVAVLQKAAAQSKSAEGEKAALQQQLAALQKNEAQYKMIENEKAALQQQVAQLQKAVTDAKASGSAAQTAAATETAQLRQQVASLQAAAAGAQAVATEKDSMAQQVAQLQKALTDRDASLAAATAQQSALQAQMSALQKQAGDTQKIAGAAAVEKTAMQSQLDALKSSLAQKEQQILALNSQPKIDQAAADQRVAQEVGKVRAEADQQMIALNAQSQAQAQNVAALQGSLAAKDKELADLRAQPKTDPAIMKQVADLQTAVAQTRRDADLLREQNNALRQQSDRAQAQLAEAQANGSSRADRVAAIQLENDELKRQIAMKDTQSATYQNQLAVAQQESASLKTRLGTVEGQRSGNNEEIGQLTRQVQQLQQQIDGLQSSAAAMSAARTASAASAASYNNIAPAAGPASVSPAVIQAASYTPPAAQTPASSGFDRASIQTLLQKSGISAGVTQASGGFGGADNFAWSDNGVRGMASVKTLGGADFNTVVNQYIAYQKSQCGGDFASMPSPSNGSAAKQMSLYEVACVSPSQSLSSSLVFFEDQGRFIAISNQIGAADMDIAMDSRDKIAGFVRNL